MNRKPPTRGPSAAAAERTATGQPPAATEAGFTEVVGLIRSARQHAAQQVNASLIELYWRIGEYLHHRIERDGWKRGTVVRLAAFIALREPGVRGFSP